MNLNQIGAFQEVADTGVLLFTQVGGVPKTAS